MTEFVSLFVIVMLALIAPFISHLIPRSLLPEVVISVAGGMVLGPHVLGWIEVSHSIELLSELGLAFLFLLAGYEIDIKDIKGTRGGVALVAWFATLALAFGAVWIMPYASPFSIEGTALMIALSATAIGTLMPILKERGLLKTAVGKAVLAHGTVGEIGPILAMALLLSVRSTFETIALLAIFIAVSVLMGIIPAQMRRFGTRITHLLHLKAESTAQATVRLTVAVLVGLVTLASVFELDVVLGAFAAGFIIRMALPQGREELEMKLDGLAYGFFIPVFFIVSGASIDPKAVAEAPWALVGVVGLLLAVRAVPVWISTMHPEQRDELSRRERATVALYSTTSLPMIVAVTHVAISADAMDQDLASILVAAGALSVLVMPFLAELSGAAAEAIPVDFAIRHLRQSHRVARPTQMSKSRARKVKNSNPPRDPEAVARKQEARKTPSATTRKTSNKSHGTSSPAPKKLKQQASQKGK